MLSDLRYATRQLLRTPGFTAVALLSLALGIGATTAIFSLVNAVLLKALPVRTPSELVTFKWTEMEPNGLPLHNIWGADRPFSKLTFEQLEERNETLADLFAFGQLSEPNVTIDGQTEIAEGAQLVSGRYFRGLGVQPFLGRLIGEGDDRAGAMPVAVVSYRYWQRRLGGDPAALGKSIQVNGISVSIVGVAPPGFLGVAGAGSPRDLSLPLALWQRVGPTWAASADARGTFWWLSVMGRLRPGSSPAQAQANLEGPFAQSLRDIYSTMKGRPINLAIPRFEAHPASRSSYGSGDYRKTLSILMGLVGLVLVIACGNVANLLLARGAARKREIAVRLALGASRGRVVRQLFTESALIALLGAAFGLLLAGWAKGPLMSLHPVGQGPVMVDLELDSNVLGFTTLLAVGTCLLFGMAPALRATRLDLTAEFQGGTRGTIGSRSALRLGRALLVVQVALSVVLLIGTGLFVRTLGNLQRVDAGFERHRLLLFRIDAARMSYDAAKFEQLCERIAGKLTALPGIRAVAYSTVPTLSGSEHGEEFSIPGQAPSRGHPLEASENTVSANFFEVLGAPIVLGRGFNPRDDSAAPKVTVINQTMAKAFFGDENPVGRQIKPMGEIVGVVRDFKYLDLKEAVPPTAYRCFPQAPGTQANFALRTAPDPRGAIDSVRSVVRGIEPALGLAEIRTQDEQVDKYYAQERLIARLGALFGTIALALVCVGLYGLTSYAMLLRTSEIGLRMALGALPGRVLRMILREWLALVLIGTGLGIAAGCAGTRLVSSMLFGLSAVDPATYLGVVGILAVVALVACWLPARRAAQIDPAVALRAE